MSPVLAAGCVLDLVHTTLAVESGAWLERTRFEVRAAPTCAWVELVLPADALLDAMEGKVRYGDDTRKKLTGRWTLSDRGADGTATVHVSLPDLLEGDRLILDVRRAWSDPTFVFAPGDAAEATLDPPKGASVAGDSITHPAVTGGAPEPTGPPAGDLRRERRLTLIVPDGDPQLKLYPGAGSRVRTDELLVVPPSAVEQSVALPIRVDQAAEIRVAPETLGAVERGTTFALVRVAPSETPVRVEATWDTADAPTFGEWPVDVEAFTVDAPGGEVRWEGRGWVLAGMRDRPILPNGETAIRALEHRFRVAAIPEPGLPQDLRGRTATWALAADLRPTLFERAMPGLEADPLWPRKLIRARGSGVLSDSEAMLILWVYAQQAAMQADWALARDASRGPGFRTTPAGYDRPLLRIEGGDEVRWIDPGCTVCAPFELRPELEGADVLSPTALRTPPPTEGRQEVVVGADKVRWTLSGPAALRLRLWLEPMAGDERGTALAERLAGPGATLVGTQGIDVAGEAIVIEANRAGGVVLDPLALPAVGPEGAWLDWVGERVRSFRTDDDVHEATFQSEAVDYRRTAVEGVVTERLTVRARQVPAADARVIEALRRGVGP